MKTLKNLTSTFIIVFCHYFLIGQNDNSCDKYVENENIQLYIDAMEKGFLSQNQIDSNCLNIIICTRGSITSLFQITIIDSTISYFDYIYRNGKFDLGDQKVLNHFIPKDLGEINGFYQYWSCHSRTDKFSKCISVYSHGILKSRVMFEGVEYSNSHLPKTEKLKYLFSVLNEISR